MSQIDQIWSWRGRLTLQKARLTQSSLRAWSTSRTRLFSRSRRPRSRQSPALLSLSHSGAPAALVPRIFANLAREKGGSRALFLPCLRRRGAPRDVLCRVFEGLLRQSPPSARQTCGAVDDDERLFYETQQETHKNLWQFFFASPALRRRSRSTPCGSSYAAPPYSVM